MTVEIHATAIVDPKATLGEGVKIGPYSLIGPDVKLGDRVELISHVNLSGNTTIAEDCRLYPFVSMGYEPQDFKHNGGPVGIEIGPRCTFRENVNIHPGTDIGKPITRIGHDCYFMVGTHLAHEGQMGNHVIVSNGAQIGGHSSTYAYWGARLYRRNGHSFERRHPIWVCARKPRSHGWHERSWIKTPRI